MLIANEIITENTRMRSIGVNEIGMTKLLGSQITGEAKVRLISAKLVCFDRLSMRRGVVRITGAIFI